MTDNRDPLKDLWQQQDVSSFDIAVLKKQWRRIRLKQFFYTTMDLLPVLAAPILLWFFYPRFHWFELVWFGALVLLSTAYSGYIVWLRRHSLASSKASTANYVDMISTQYKQNIKIAMATKYSTFAIPPFFIILYAGLYNLDIFEFDRWLRKATISFGLLSLVLPALWVWADRRMKKFTNELANLDKLIQGN